MHWLVGVAIKLSLFAFFILVLHATMLDVDRGNSYFYWENDLLVGLDCIMKNNLNSFFLQQPPPTKENPRIDLTL